MKDEEFMKQRVCDMSIGELKEAIKKKEAAKLVLMNKKEEIRKLDSITVQKLCLLLLKEPMDNNIYLEKDGKRLKNVTIIYNL